MFEKLCQTQSPFTIQKALEKVVERHYRIIATEGHYNRLNRVLISYSEDNLRRNVNKRNGRPEIASSGSPSIQEISIGVE